MIGRNDTCWCGSGKKWKKCHYPEPGSAPDQDEIRSRYYNLYDIILKSDSQIAGMRRSCNLAADILEKTCQMAKAGVTTGELNDYAHRLHEEAGATPAPLHYGEPPFPKSICTSLNDVICHGIPDNTVLKEGDIMNVDVTCILDGYYGDCSKMVLIGEVDEEKRHVCDVSYQCLERAIRILKPGIYINEIGRVIEEYAHSQDCSVVYQFVAHGIGIHFHEGPQIPHNKNDLNIRLVPGMTFTIEPMINLGKPEAEIDPSDQWTARTIDGKASAQYERTVFITDDGYETLTNWKR